MSNSPKISKLRWLTGAAAKKDREMAVDVTPALWDCGSFMSCNSKYVAFPTSSSGCTAVIPHSAFDTARGYKPHKTVGHKGHVIDLAFNPFHDDILYTGSEDSTVKTWRIPDEYNKDISEPVATLSGHNRKVGILAPHPSADNVLATAGMDHVINIFDVTVAAPKLTFADTFKDQVLSLNWNLDGSLLNCTAKDKMVHVLDSRSGKIAQSGKAHEGSKTMRSVWAKRRNQIITLGFNRSQYRQLMIFDARDISKPIYTHELDQMSNIMVPFFDEDTNMLFIGGRGEAGIKYFEVWDEAVPLVPLNAYSGGEPMKGMCAMPKATLDVKSCELQRFYKMSNKVLTSISFTLPRRQGATQFQSDIYPTTFGGAPSIGADDFFAGKNAVPAEISLASKFDGGDVTVATTGALSQPTSPVSPNNNKKEDLSEQIATQKKKVGDLEALLKAEQGKLAELEKKQEAEKAAAEKAAGGAAAAAAAEAPAERAVEKPAEGEKPAEAEKPVAEAEKAAAE